MKIKMVIFATLSGFLNLDAAPTTHTSVETNLSEDHVRTRRSQYAPQNYGSPVYQQPSYISPCAAASAAASSYPLNLAPTAHGNALYGLSSHGISPAVNYGGYGLPHYRSDLVEEFESAERDHNPNMRSNGGYEELVPHGDNRIYGTLVPSAPGAPAVGIFPGAHQGGCSVPLLLSCSPTVVTGQLVRNQEHYGPVAPAHAQPEYRGVEPFNSKLSKPDEHHTRSEVPQKSQTTNSTNKEKQ